VVQLEEASQVLHPQPVLGLDGKLEAEALREGEEWLPEEIVVRDDDPRVGAAHAVQRAEGGPDVEEVADHIGQDDVVEGAVLELGGIERLRVTDDELEARVLPPGELDEGGRDIEADRHRRFAGGQEVPGAAADLQDARALGDHEAHQPLDGAVVRSVSAAPAVALARIAVVGRHAPLAIGRFPSREIRAGRAVDDLLLGRF
jgi:hypothetical protein